MSVLQACGWAATIRPALLRLIALHRTMAPKKSPIWENVHVLSDKDASGNYELCCKHCQVQYKGSANRILHHLAGTGANISACDMCPPDVNEQAKKQLNAGVLRKQLKVTKLARSRSDSELDLTDEPGSPSKAAKLTPTGTGNIKSLLSKQTKHEVRVAVEVRLICPSWCFPAPTLCNL